MTLHRRPRKRRGKARDLLKDRLIQTRVPEGLESALKQEARKRRLSVSHLIRNVLEDTFHLVDNVVAEVDHLVQDSVDLAMQVGRDAGRIADTARKAAKSAHHTDRRQERNAEPAASPPPHVDAPSDVLAWNEVVLNQAGQCAKCGKALAKGDKGYLGMTATPRATPAWLCSRCMARVSR